MEKFEETYEIDRVLDARGTEDKRFYLVKWKGWDVSEASWLHSRELQDAQKCVDVFWKIKGLPTSSVLNPQSEIRCEDCNKLFKREQDLKRHGTVGCPWKEASRVGSKAETTVQKSKQAAIQVTAGVVMMGEKRLENVFNFDYLGFRFQADGDRICALEQRMAIARTSNEIGAESSPAVLSEHSLFQNDYEPPSHALSIDFILTHPRMTP